MSGSPHLIDRIAGHVVRNPEAVAITAGKMNVLYRQLWGRVLELTGELLELGLVQGDRVAILSENSPDYIAAYCSILNAGGVVVPLNSQTRSRDLQAWIKHSDSRLLMADKDHPETSNVKAGITGLGVVELDKVHDYSGYESSYPTELTSRRGSEELAAILYTSGTTGTPKGIMLSHGNLAKNTIAIIEYLEIGENDSVLNVLPFFYSYGNSVLQTHLWAGGRIVIENKAAFPARVWEGLAREQVSGLAGVPATFALLLSRVNPKDYDLHALRYVTQAGGAMSKALTQRLRSALPASSRIFVMYGQTEATARLTYLPPERLTDKMGSVGLPLSGVSLEIRDSDGLRVAGEQTGEIWVRGPNVMMGYWKDPKATQNQLIDGWLKTGDLGYLDDEGFLFIVGRSSDMIKTGAHRVSPLDIEEVLVELDGIEEAAVVGVEDPLLGQAIKACVVRSRDSSISAKAVLAHCRSQLALYKVPREVEFLDSLPKTSSGKVQRHLLNQPQSRGTEATDLPR
ncbi:MAG: class I adenylate-forming enzyme family protein [Pseudomonadales bacterium]